MKIKLTTVHVDDQQRALQFYTEILGFVKKADIRNGPFRWLTVTSPEDPNGSELQLAELCPRTFCSFPREFSFRLQGALSGGDP